MKVTTLRFLLAITMFILLVFRIFAQTPVTDTYVSTGNSIAPSPGVSSLAQFASMPVNLSNGTVNISVPLVALQGHSMTLPVSLSYQTSGIRVNDVASQVGLGWSLNAGGVITRIVRDKPDDEAIKSGFNTYYHGYAGPNYNSTGRWFELRRFITERTNPDDQLYRRNLDSLVNNYWDSEPDIYYFNFLGRTGKFILDHTTDGNRVKPVLISQQDLKVDLIIPQQPTGNGGIIDQTEATWVITTSDGTSYIFGNINPSTVGSNTNAIEKTQQETHLPDINDCLPERTETTTFTSSWYLKEIISPQGNTEFTFEYLQGDQIAVDNVTRIKYEYIWRNSELFPECALTSQYPTAESNHYSITTTIKTLNPKYVSYIHSPVHGDIVFNYTTDREDLANGKKLSSIHVKDA